MATEPDYYIVTLETGRGPFPWRWEIRRHSKPMGIRLGASGFRTQIDAEQAGKLALAKFSDELAREGRRK